jgi:multidrug efflux pump subunit AcrB
MLQDREGRGYDALNAQAWALIAKANAQAGLKQVYTLFDVGTPRVYADIDRRKADLLGVPPERIFEALEVYLGSAFVNDFNLWAAPIASPHRPTRNTARPWPTLPT